MTKMKYIFSLLLALTKFYFDLAKVDCTEYFTVADYKATATGFKTERLKEDTAEELEAKFEEEKDTHDDYIKILIFEGAEFRNAIKNKNQLWKNGEVPYTISNVYSSKDRKFILKAMEEFRNKTCVRFRPRKEENSFISIIPGRGCSAFVGNVTRVNRVNLGTNCLVKGIVLHELMHALGFVHEQNRPDRDEFVRIDFDNIRENSIRNFNIMKDAQTFNQTYDYGSVMHYGEFDFAKNRSKPTIIPQNKGVKIGQRRGFSDTDLIKINLLYNCNDRQNSGNESEEIRDDEITTEELDESGSNTRLHSLHGY